MHKKNRTADWGVIFDLDGTMVSNTSYHRQAWFDLCQRYQIPMNMDLYHQKVHARSNDKIVPNLFGPDVDRAFIDKIELEKETLYRQTYGPVMKPTAGALALLEALAKENIPCAAATNSPKDNVDFILDGLKIRPRFKSIVCRDLVKVGKPDPEMLFLAAAGLNLSPQRCVLFEDSASGFKAARAAGMPCIAITAGADPGELKEADGAAAVCEDFTQITVSALAAIVTANAHTTQLPKP